MANDKQVPTPHQAFVYRHMFKFVAAVAIIVIAGTVAAWYLNRPDASQDQTAASLTEANQKEGDARLTLLEAAYRDAATDEGKAQAALHLGVYYSEQQDYKKSLGYFQEADELTADDDVNIMLGIADAAKQAKELSVAKEYYQKALDYYQAHPEQVQSDTTITSIESALATLED